MPPRTARISKLLSERRLLELFFFQVLFLTPSYLLRGTLHPWTSRMSVVALVVVVVMPVAPVQSDEQRLDIEQK